VSESLSLKSDPISQPAAKDPLERQTWSSLRIQIGNRLASRLWDKTLDDERVALDVPTFPIAEWLIKNWWQLFNELCPGNSIPESRAMDSAWLGWAGRHCIRSADSSLFLPKLYLYADGRGLVAESRADRPGSLPNMPGEFLTDGVASIDPVGTEAALVQFINQTLRKVEGIDDDRVERAVGQWHAIVNADPEEIEFCGLSGRMGLDPYDPEEVSESLSDLFEAILSDGDRPVVRDLTEAAKPGTVEAQWNWIGDVSRSLQLGPRSIDLPFDLPPSEGSPAEYGYELARRVRAFVGVGDSPIESVEKTAGAAIGRDFRVLPRNDVPGREIKAIVGQAGSGEFIAAGPAPPSSRGRRFMDARSLFHALATSTESPRLVTGAYSLDQKASRAFAAEFLAPRKALLDKLPGSYAGPDHVERLGNEFRVSAYAIQWQLENAGVSISSD